MEGGRLLTNWTRPAKLPVASRVTEYAAGLIGSGPIDRGGTKELSGPVLKLTLTSAKPDSSAIRATYSMRDTRSSAGTPSAAFRADSAIRLADSKEVGTRN